MWRFKFFEPFGWPRRTDFQTAGEKIQLKLNISCLIYLSMVSENKLTNKKLLGIHARIILFVQTPSHADKYADKNNFWSCIGLCVSDFYDLPIVEKLSSVERKLNEICWHEVTENAKMQLQLNFDLSEIEINRPKSVQLKLKLILPFGKFNIQLFFNFSNYILKPNFSWILVYYKYIC